MNQTKQAADTSAIMNQYTELVSNLGTTAEIASAIAELHMSFTELIAHSTTDTPAQNYTQEFYLLQALYKAFKSIN